MLRDVVIRATLNEMVGDETYELWLKEGAGAWTLYEVGEVGAGPTQDFPLNDLTEDVTYRMQLRATRESRYREDYIGNDPDDWPVQSLLIFIPGTEEYAAPTIDSVVWSRTSGSSQRVTVGVTASSGNEGLFTQLLRGGVVVDEITGSGSLVDLDPPIAAEHSYTVRHRSAFLVGLQSAPALRWAGPDKPTGLLDITSVTWYSYAVSFDTPPSGATTRWQDTWTSIGSFNNRGVTAADATTLEVGFGGLEKNSSNEPNGNIPAYCEVRARHEIEAFSVTDVSDWSDPVWIETEIASDEDAWDPQSPPL